MPTFYSVVQYVPDPLTGERINIGIIAVGESEIESRFLNSWSRVECFAAGRDISSLLDFAEALEGASPSQLGLSGLTIPESITVDKLSQMSLRWTNAIQFTPLGTSLQPPAQLLASLAPRFLHAVPTREPVASRPKDRRRAAAIAHSALAMAVSYRALPVQVKRREFVQGALEEYRFDSVALNGKPLMAAHGVSFLTAVDEAERSIDALGQAIRDVKEKYPDLPIGVVALRSENQESLRPYNRAVHLFGNYGAQVLREEEAQDWALDASAKYVDISSKGKDESDPQSRLPLLLA